MNLSQPDLAQQNWVDLNTRRSQGDIQGIIGSPPGWNGVGPKPARAYWVPVNSSDGLAKSRYAFWIEDNSFRANISQIDNPASPTTTASRVDNTTQPLDSANNSAQPPPE